MMDHDGHQQEPLSTEQPSTEQLGQWEAPQSDLASAEKAPKLLQVLSNSVPPRLCQVKVGGAWAWFWVLAGLYPGLAGYIILPFWL